LTILRVVPGDEANIVRGELAIVRPADDRDVDLLVGWHADPDVSRYWDDETFTREQMLERLARHGVDPFIVEEAGRPVGYLQVWREGESGGLDMFLIPDARGRGLGPDAARAVATELLRRGWTRVTVDPYAWNESAVRAWRRAGFVDVEEREPDEEHAARWLLMEFQA
jgi:aminoglycoside 6'-N-acetyltransferase